MFYTAVHWKQLRLLEITELTCDVVQQVGRQAEGRWNMVTVVTWVIWHFRVCKIPSNLQVRWQRITHQMMWSHFDNPWKKRQQQDSVAQSQLDVHCMHLDCISILFLAGGFRCMKLVNMIFRLGKTMTKYVIRISWPIGWSCCAICSRSGFPARWRYFFLMFSSWCLISSLFQTTSYHFAVAGGSTTSPKGSLAAGSQWRQVRSEVAVAATTV